MSANTKIEWCDHTFNPWIGCTKVSPGCDSCYAERDTPVRVLRARGSETWGALAERHRTAPSTWRQARAWNRQHEAFYALHGRRQRVFCASLADVFDNQVPTEWRADLFRLIRDTPNLDWLLLTKRIGNVDRLAMEANSVLFQAGEGFHRGLPANAQLGASIVNEQELHRDIHKLLRTQASVRFVCFGPLLGPVSFEGLFANEHDYHDGTNALEEIDWVIVEGESGPSARPMHPEWAASLRNQCESANVPFFFKQWGEWLPTQQATRVQREMSREEVFVRYVDGSTHSTAEHDHEPYSASDAQMLLIGKKAAGRLLDGREHNGFPRC